ncbi:MAG: chemotaxis protein CheD [Lachnospiraceae bacterium]|nr:chemotaxis protein CheD [Lachnospiraceae bacterium]
MGQMIKVGMADLKVCKEPDSLTTIGLGSCVGIALYDPVTKVTGLAHIMLPDSKAIRNNSNIAKFADTGIEELVKQMVKAGASKTRLVAKIAGGAKMFALSGSAASAINIGEQNAAASKKKLKELGIRLIAEDCGLNYGRTVELYSETGKYLIKAVGKPVKEI